jgi:hypothetical protein
MNLPIYYLERVKMGRIKYKQTSLHPLPIASFPVKLNDTP